MPLLVTSTLPFLAHNHASAVAFVTCRSHNFHGSIIPEFLNDEERVKTFCETPQQNEPEVEVETQYRNLFNLFVQTPLMQFSPSLVLRQEDSAESILKPLLETKYFTRTLQRCVVAYGVHLTTDLFQGLSRVRSLTNLDLGWSEVENEHLEIIINSFPSLENLTIHISIKLQPSVNIDSPPPAATKTLRTLTMHRVDASVVTQLVPHFTNLRKLELCAEVSYEEPSKPGLDLLPVSSSLSLLTNLFLDGFSLENTESLHNLVHLSSLQLGDCRVPDLSFLTQGENATNLPELRTLCIGDFGGLLTSAFAPLAHAPNLHVLDVAFCECFQNDCLQYLESMVHLRKLDVSYTQITGDIQSFMRWMQKLNQLEELNLEGCGDIGNNQGAIAGALYISTHSRLRVLNLRCCDLVDDDLDGIGALKNTLEVLVLNSNSELTNEGLVHCKDLAKLKRLNLSGCTGITDLSPLKDCVNLEHLDVSCNRNLTDDSFKVFSEEPNSFPNLCDLDMSNGKTLTGNVFEHLLKNKNLGYQLKDLHVGGMFQILSSSSTARNNLCQLKGLRILRGVASDPWDTDSDEKVTELKAELVRRLRNIEHFI